MPAPAHDFDPETGHRLEALSDALSEVQQQFRDHLEAALAPLTIALDVLAHHTACLVRPRDAADQAVRPTS